MVSSGKSTTSIHRYLTKCLDKHGFLPLGSSQFQPNISTKTQYVVASLLLKFSGTLSNVAPTLSSLPGKLITRVTTPTKVGSYLETVLTNMKSASQLAPDIDRVSRGRSGNRIADSRPRSRRQWLEGHHRPGKKRHSHHLE